MQGLLPGRRHIVLTRNRDWSSPGAETVHDVDEAIAKARGEPLSVIGGADLFALFLPLSNRIELTEVIADVEGDTFVDDPRRLGNWKEVRREDHPAEDGRPAFSFVTLEKA